MGSNMMDLVSTNKYTTGLNFGNHTNLTPVSKALIKGCAKDKCLFQTCNWRCTKEALKEHLLESHQKNVCFGKKNGWTINLDEVSWKEPYIDAIIVNSDIFGLTVMLEEDVLRFNVEMLSQNLHRYFSLKVTLFGEKCQEYTCYCFKNKSDESNIDLKLDYDLVNTFCADNCLKYDVTIFEDNLCL
ncbi:uncharacterized protein LOC126265352 isoform X3 [Aethina tumida]|uniref:uncharacterized protein LOC126265352 isoform X3 n=1 Tax=Aethina tumida TaxID=116153 RepID=UPI0021474E41|nr:uncharacterized protein LOC126265352 isoform X3 [Aethina tumida]XP_049822425.1 uncharacterized protein LOC126265352 isoform X3 [Aethina tumida]XP_049822427.1 uncharacterized protein LOC126265352 isoform X3 [Aethina tumida]